MMIYTIIVTYNAMRRDWIAKCLNSLRDSSVPTTPVVVDNCSTDDTVKFVRENYPEAVLFPQTRNLGFGQGNNLGIRYAMDNDADYVLLLNQDATLAPNALKILTENSDGRSLLTPIHMNGVGEKIDHFFKRSLLNTDNTFVDDNLLNDVKAKYPIGMFCAACWFMPKVIINEVGGFDPLFFHYGEDDNYYNRIKYHGFKSYVVPGARMFHDRNEHGNNEAFSRNQLYREILVAATNPCLSMKERGVQIFRVWSNHKSYVFEYVASLLKMMRGISAIRNSRSMSKQKGRTWL